MKKFTLRLLILATITIWGAVYMLPDDKLHVVFCNVGQGDATLISYKTYQILVDTGPDNRVLDCLGRHIPFYDTVIEAVVVTHDQQDHNGGSRYITERYSVVQFEPVLTKGSTLVAGPLKLVGIWPDSKILGMNTLGKENDEGIVSKLSWNNFKVLLTADVSTEIYEEEGVTVLKVPHHGSKYEMDQEWLVRVKPQLAVISVGKNSFGHPTQEVLTMLKNVGIKMYRTDEDGEVEIVTDGKRWWRK